MSAPTWVSVAQRLPLTLGAALALAGCSQDFQCGGKAEAFVSADVVCDGVIDCWGGQDERGDDCATELFFCDQPEPQAILASLVCNGVQDCGDGYDEAHCASATR
jgi:hypothetical protein